MSTPGRGMRRRERDVEAGMVFAWRVPGGSLGRMAAGVLVAAGLFAATAAMVRIQRPVQRDESREAARVVVLGADDPASLELLDWARFHSPFPDRWEPGSEGQLEAGMAEVTSMLEERSAYEARLRPRLVESPDLRLPGLMDGDPVTWMSLEGPARRSVPVGVALPVEVVSVATDRLAERWGRRSIVWEEGDAPSLMGLEARFVVGVTPDGTVEICLLREGISEEIDPKLERWLRDQKFVPDPEAGDLTWGVVRIRFQARTGEEVRDD